MERPFRRPSREGHWPPDKGTPAGQDPAADTLGAWLGEVRGGYLEPQDSRALQAKLGPLCGFWTPGQRPGLHCEVSWLGAAPALYRRSPQMRPQEEGYGGNGERQSHPGQCLCSAQAGRRGLEAVEQFHSRLGKLAGCQFLEVMHINPGEWSQLWAGPSGQHKPPWELRFPAVDPAWGP